MKAFIVAIVAVLAVSSAYPKPNNTITYEDENGNIITEDLNSPTPITFAVSSSEMDFMLYTHPDKPACKLTVGDKKSMEDCEFDPELITKILLHGWKGNHLSEHVQKIKDAYMRGETKLNVLAVDYGKYCSSLYLSAVYAAPKVGISLCEFIKFLGIPLEKLHIIGHSLGAHVAHYAAKCVNSANNKVGRITGLDPAGPWFCDAPAEYRLSVDDGLWVDCIHTSFMLGCSKPHCSANYYPEGGREHKQCANEMIKEPCNHAASWRFYAESIPDRAAFPAWKCDNPEDAQNSKKALVACYKTDTFMGEDAANTAPGSYYVDINP